MRALPCKRLLAATVTQRGLICIGSVGPEGGSGRWNSGISHHNQKPESPQTHTRIIPLLRSASCNMQHIQRTAANLRVKRKEMFKIKRKNFCHISLERGDTLAWNGMSSKTIKKITADSQGSGLKFC